jgi:hypothetical protein
MPKGPKLGSCALVAPSPSTKGKGFGPEIDSHDIVIRMNRLPEKANYPDLGNRTDVYFVNNEFIKYTSAGFHVDQVAQYIGGAWVDCKETPAECRFSSIIYQSINTLFLPQMTKSQWEQVAEGWQGTNFFVGRMSPEMDKAMHCIAGKMSHIGYPTAGFAAFLTFLPLCDSMRLYGFSGSKTLDGHNEWIFHRLANEHLVMQKIGAGQMTQQDFNFELCNGPGRPRTSRLLEYFKFNLGSFKDRVSIEAAAS